MPRGGLFWGRFWLAFSSFFYDFFVLFCFLLFLRCAAPWKATRKPKRLPRAPPEAPEAPQGLLNGTPSVPKSTRRGFQKAPDRLTRALEYPKKIREAFSRTLKFPRWPQDAPTPQEAPKRHPGHPKRAHVFLQFFVFFCIVFFFIFHAPPLRARLPGVVF